MIDLRFKELPSALEAGGISYDVDTDFRTWLQFAYLLEYERTIWDGIFKSGVPDSEWEEAALEFYASKNATPKAEPANERVLDYILDGDYIVASFQAAYGIDLTAIEYMHWHRFKALLIGLPDNSKIAKIMGYRSFKRSGKYDYNKEMEKLRAAWRLPEPGNEERRAAVLQWANEMIY